MAVRVETDFNAPETGAASRPGLFQIPRWVLGLLLVFVILLGLMILHGPDLLVSYANHFDGGTWLVPRPGFAVPILNAELKLRRYVDGLEPTLEGAAWRLKRPQFLKPALKNAAGALPGFDLLQKAASRQVWVVLKPVPLTLFLDDLQEIIPQTDRIQAAIDLEVWQFLNPDITSELLTAGLWLWPDSPELHDALGQYYLKRDLPALAEAQFEHAVGGDGELALARNNLGVALISQGSFPEAVHHLQIAAELDPGSPLVFFNLGDVYLKNGELEQAAGAFRRALDLDPELAGAWTLHGIASLYLEDFEGAQASLLKALEKNERDHSALLGLGLVAMNQGRYEDAFVYLEAASKALPADAVTRLYFGQVLQKLDKPRDAIIEFERALLLSDDPVLTGMSYAHLENLRRVLSAGNQSTGGETE